MALSPETQAAVDRVTAAHEEFAKTLASLNEAPNVATPPPAIIRGIEDQGDQKPPASRLISITDRIALKKRLREMPTSDLYAMFAEQARQKGTGIPLEVWLNAAGGTQAYEDLRGQVAPDVQRALDTGGAAAMIRQDLEPMLYELFVRDFPAYDRFPKEPANGLVHAWNQITGYGDAQFMAELGTVTDDVSTYVRQTTNIAILATRRGISLKSQYAVLAGGAGYNPEQIELAGGLRAISHKMQQTIFGGNASNSGGLSSNELGAYDANGFTGLRAILNTARAINLDPATNPLTTGSFRGAIDQAIIEPIQNGGRVSIIWGNPIDKITFDEQQDVNVRVLTSDLVNIGVGVVANQFNTINGPLPFAIVPGDSIASYVYTGSSSGGVDSGDTVRDLYVLDESSITIPYLGAPGPTVLDIPIGISGQLTHLFIIFLMNGLAVKAPIWSNKVRIKIA